MTTEHTVQESLLAKSPQVDVNFDLGDPLPCEEIKKAAMHLKAGKPPCIDGIPTEVC